MAKPTWFDTPSAIYAASKEAWERDERRLYGGDLVLEELSKWVGESDDHYKKVRLATARYLNFGEAHAATIAGHLSRKIPLGSFGGMGEVRQREKIDRETPAESFFYNCDGIGNSGTQLPAYMDGVQVRACGTGIRWLMVEMPDLAALQALRIRAGRPPGGLPATDQDRLDGFHPYLVEHSPLAVPRVRISNGVLQSALIKIPIDNVVEVDSSGNPVPDAMGYYVLVRAGYAGLGSRYVAGGWWKYDPDGVELATGDWLDTLGQIPMFPLIAEKSQGTFIRPAMARSLTMELNQISVDLMNARSEQRYNLRQAAKSVNWVLGITPEALGLVIKQLADGSIVAGVPPIMLDDGTVGVPTMWNSSEGAMATGAYAEVIQGAIDEAHEIMLKQVTSGQSPEESGVSKSTGFAEATSPLLARMAATRESCENTLRYFVGLRSGFPEPVGTVTIPRDFSLRNVVVDVDSMLDTLKKSALSSPTWETKLVLAKGDELGLLGDDKERAAIEAELQAAVQLREERKAQMDSLMNDEGPPKPEDKKEELTPPEPPPPSGPPT